MLKNLINDKPRVHTRNIRLATYPHTDSKVLVHGELKDIRYIPVFDITGEVKEPGIIHHMTLLLLIAPDPLRIIDAEAEMLTIPITECRTTLDRVELIKGLEIKAGFTGQVRKIMGGTNGCTHLCGLVTVMAQEIVHGWLTQKRREKSPVPQALGDIKEKKFLIDSCRIWKEDGPRMKQLVRAIQGKTPSVVT